MQLLNQNVWPYFRVQLDSNILIYFCWPKNIKTFSMLSFFLLSSPYLYNIQGAILVLLKVLFYILSFFLNFAIHIM